MKTFCQVVVRESFKSLAVLNRSAMMTRARASSTSGATVVLIVPTKLFRNNITWTIFRIGFSFFFLIFQRYCT